jgi:tRNA-dihydrouridine synthase B
MAATFKPLRIGGITVDFPVALAPLAGFSDLPYRLVCRSLDAPYCTTEAMLDRQALVHGKFRKRLIAMDPADRPLAAQIMGNDPEAMAGAAAALRGLGFDAIDLNFACPVKKVLSRKRGGFLMKEPKLALEIVRAVLEAAEGTPVTLKLRRAFRNEDATCDAFWEIARGGFEAGVAAVCAHARSVEQKYRGRADWEFLARVKREFPDKTIIGSGDVLHPADALRMIEETGVDGVAAARGAIGNPWFFRQARDLAAGREAQAPALEEQRRVVTRHYELARDTYGPGRGLKKIVHFGLQYAKMHPSPAKVRGACLKVRTEADWRAFLDEYYGPPGGLSEKGSAPRRFTGENPL